MNLIVRWTEDSSGCKHCVPLGKSLLLNREDQECPHHFNFSSWGPCILHFVFESLHNFTWQVVEQCKKTAAIDGKHCQEKEARSYSEGLVQEQDDLENFLCVVTDIVVNCEPVDANSK